MKRQTKGVRVWAILNGAGKFIEAYRVRHRATGEAIGAEKVQRGYFVPDKRSKKK